ncbi:MAG: menaquinone biosynthetic enzyme MqnA/MqnD family protein [Thermoplasmatota archaeon]
MKIGDIDFLNSLPVYLALERGEVALPHGASLVRGAPTALNAKLLAGELDVSPVSSIEYARHADELVLLPDLSINSKGFVHSVTLFYRDDLESLRGGSVAVTDASATSEVLLRILLAKHFKIDARAEKRETDLEEVGHAYAAALLIGDLALRGTLAYPSLGRRDLGLEWSEFAGAPMVFAVWVARRDFARDHPREVEAAHAALLASKAWGETNRAQVVEYARKRAFLSRSFMERYFRDLDYGFDAEKRRGLAAFYENARDLGELNEVPSL